MTTCPSSQPDRRLPQPRRPVSPLKVARVAAGLLQAELADAAGVTELQVSRLERGMCDPRLRTAQRLAAVLGVEPGDIFPFNSEAPGVEGFAKTAGVGDRHGED